MAEKTPSGFTDIHTHILPGVDDGVPDLNQALALITMAWEDGTRSLILTPHYRGEFRSNTPEALNTVFSQLKKETALRYPEMTLYLGSEVFFEHSVPRGLLDGSILRLNGTQYVLLEFSPGVYRSRILFGVTEVLHAGFTPIIAHVDRCEIFRKSSRLLDELTNMGALIQLNADSVMGKRGFRVARLCHQLLKRQKIHFIASDAHDPKHRPPLLRRCYERICRRYGEYYARQLFITNPQALLEDIAI